MAIRTARLLALPFALLACVLRVAGQAWAHPGSFRSTFLTFLVVHLISLVLPTVAYVLVTRPVRKRPAAWGPDFSAGPNPQTRGILAVVLGWNAGFALVQVGDTGGTGLDVFMLVFGLLTLVTAVVVALNERPTVTIGPAGITVRGWFGSRRAGWDEPIRLPVAKLHIDPGFLARSLAFYRAHPEHRAELVAEVPVPARPAHSLP
ncbi:PH domain-containing protein [Actinoplanes sp. HUAS TT8]|uniref:PH domain-containing protein n=1 Tax=Actinoplanes sp. HUAS TT8 TaxID=3447453 RepID=UPI003F52619E